MNARDLVATSGENGGFTIFDKDKEKSLKMISTWHTNWSNLLVFARSAKFG